MRDKELYTRILGIQPPWTVADIELDMKAGKAYRMGYIDVAQLERLAQVSCPNGYGTYLSDLLQQEIVAR